MASRTGKPTNDEYVQLAADCKKKLNLCKTLLDQKNKALKAKQSTAQAEYQLLINVEELERVITKLNEIGQQYTAQPYDALEEQTFVDLSVEEKSSRLKKIQEFSDDLEPFQTYLKQQETLKDVKPELFGQQNTTSQSQMDEESKGEAPLPQLTTDQEKNDYYRANLADQDKGLDMLAAQLQHLKGLNENFQDELDIQKPLIDKTGTAMDKTNAKLKKINGRLERLVANMDFKQLWFAIAIEAIIILLLIIF